MDDKLKQWIQDVHRRTNKQTSLIENHSFPSPLKQTLQESPQKKRELTPHQKREIIANIISRNARKYIAFTFC